MQKRIEKDAREIVPAFNAWVYFRAGYAIARALARSLYRVRLGTADDAGLRAIPDGSTVVFVMNHRSNMDYFLLSYLAAEKTALSYAVGEWARIWPLQSFLRATGAYFVRRDSKDPLYRRVLERWVAMATANGVPQAVYPEGGLSQDGALRPPKLGLLDYMIRGFDPNGTPGPRLRPGRRQLRPRPRGSHAPPRPLSRAGPGDAARDDRRNAALRREEPPPSR